MGTQNFRQVTLTEELIAPCGINCALCSGHHRTINTCYGCNSESGKPSYCKTCIIKSCPEKKGPTEFCFDCDIYPCKRMKQLEKRYREKYGEPIFTSLQTIKEQGLATFIESEKQKWTCSCGKILCVHKDRCLQCGEKNPYYTGTKK